ncbi:MAG: type II secretion system F family protein [Caldilineaceae bacterium]
MDGLLLGLSMGLAIWLIVYGYGLRKQATALDPLALARSAEDAPVRAPSSSPIRQRLLLAAKRWASHLARENIWLPQPLNLEQRLAWAGKLGQVSLEQFRGDQILNLFGLAFLGAVFGLYRGSNGLALVLALAGGATGLYLPIFQLDQDGKKRQQEITITLPDAVDLISTSVTAGLPIDRAIDYAAENITGPLAEELTTFLEQMQLGKPRQEAYQELIWRNNSDEIQIIVGALLQGQSLGAPVAETLEAQAENMRERRLQRAKEAGAKVAPRISLVMVVCIVPSIFLMFLAMMIYSIYTGSGSLFSNLF